MPETDIKKILWQNIARLMISRWGKENLTRLASEAKIGPGTATRLKEQQTSTGADVLEKIAGVFSVQSWQLLVPDLDPQKLPSLGGDSSGWPMPLIDKASFLSLSMESRVFVQGYLKRLIEERAVLENNGGTGASPPRFTASPSM